MNAAKVILIGGAPGAGKTTLGRALAEKLGRSSLSIDDLFTAAKAVTTPESHPGLHVMSLVNYVEYFTTTPVDRLKADATVQHEATWPAVERVIRHHAAWGTPIVIDGWALRPDKVARLALENVASYWVVTDPSFLEERERANIEFVSDSPDPERMLKNLLARSIWFNELIRKQTKEHRLNVLCQDGGTSVQELCRAVLEG